MLAAQFESFRDPFIILAGSVPLAISGALLFSFLGLTTLNIYSQVGLITLVGLVSKNGILIVRVCQSSSGEGTRQAARDHRGGRTRAAADPDDDRCHGRRTFSARSCNGSRSGSAQQHRIMLVSGMIVGTFFTLFVVPSIYMLLARTRVGAASTEDMKRTDNPWLSIYNKPPAQAGAGSSSSGIS